MEDGWKPLTTHSLKELLVSKTVEMEATTNTNISALVTMYVVARSGRPSKPVLLSSPE